MAKSKPVVDLDSYGIYETWDPDNKALPRFLRFTQEVDAELDIEFGLIVNIRRAKGQKIRYCIYHPDIPDEDGIPMAPFDGEEYIRSNDWQFYLGDTLWAPLHNKLGNWRMTIELQGQIVADKTFTILEPCFR